MRMRSIGLLFFWLESELETFEFPRNRNWNKEVAVIEHHWYFLPFPEMVLLVFLSNNIQMVLVCVFIALHNVHCKTDGYVT